MFTNENLCHIINGGFMKKLIIISVVLITILIFNNDGKILTVGNVLETNINDTQIIYLIIPNLNTKNINKYFSDDNNIIGIFPYVNPIYRSKLGDMFYNFKKKSLSDNIKDFTKYYKEILGKNNFNNDLIMIDYKGINIEKIKLYMSGEELELFVKKCNKCRYEKTLLD